jgi:hypothetical protein
VNTTTTRASATAAETRAGRGASAPTNDRWLDAILADPTLGPTAKLIATALVRNWARFKDHAWPSDRTIAARVGKSPGHVQRCLRELEAAGWIVRERTDEVTSGRRIWLVRRSPGGMGAQPEAAPAPGGPAAPALSEQLVVVTGGVEQGEIAVPERRRPEPSPNVLPAAPAPLSEPSVPPAPAEVVKAVGPPPVPRPEPATPAAPCVPLTPEQQVRLAELPAAARDQTLIWLATGDPILMAEARKRLVPPRPRADPPRTLPEALGRVREDPSFPALAADWLARAFNDRKSYGGFLARCSEAWRGEIEVEQLLSAFNQAMGPRAKNPGAVFMHAMKRASP